jgi:hypothetical protein
MYVCYWNIIVVINDRFKQSMIVSSNQSIESQQISNHRFHVCSLSLSLSLFLSLCRILSREKWITYPENKSIHGLCLKQDPSNEQIRSSRELPPPKMLHVLIFVFAGPHDLALPKRLDVRDGRDEPHDDEEDCQGAADAVDPGASQGGADLDGGEG